MPFNAHFAAAPQRIRPRYVNNAILLGKGVVLAQQVVEQGCLYAHLRDDEEIAALLSIAYGKSIHAADPICETIRSASGNFIRQSWMIEPRLAALPEPLPDCAERLALADQLLKSGVRPRELATAMRRAPLGLRPVPDYAAGLMLCEAGVVLGNGTVIAPLADLPGERTGLGVAGREERIVTLLSLGRQGLAPPEVLRKFQAASQALAKGDVVHATFLLCHAGQPRLMDRELAKSLDHAARRLDKGASGYVMLKAKGLATAEMRRDVWEKFVKDFSPDEPRDDHGRWTDGGGGSNSGNDNSTGKNTGLGMDKKPTETPPSQSQPDGKSAGQPGGDLEAAASGVNPSNSTLNCLDIAETVAARLSGESPNATAGDTNGGSLEGLESHFHAKLNWAYPDMDHVYSKLTNSPDGTMAVVMIYNEDKTEGHAVIIANNHGSVGIVEGQNWRSGGAGVIYDPGVATKRYTPTGANFIGVAILSQKIGSMSANK